MNKKGPKSGSSLLTFVVIPTSAIIALSGLVSCSTSRTMNTEVVLGPGTQTSRTVQVSDILIRSGSELNVAYSAGNRFYVAKGGALTGFTSGARNTRIYAELGAILPSPLTTTRTRIITVPSATKAYQERYKALPPLKVEDFANN